VRRSGSGFSRSPTGHGVNPCRQGGLACAEGLDNQAVAKKLRCSKAMVCKWRSRFLQARLEGLYDEPRPGAPRKISDDQVERVVIQTLESTQRGETHWSTRGLAKATGLSRMTVSRIWHAFGLQPHRSETFKLSPDPQLIEKVRDIVGLYMNPPDHAMVLCIDEKSQIQALDRTQPLLPMRPGQLGRGTHDYKRNGTGCTSHHGQLWNAQDRHDPEMDRQAASFHLHFTPTYGSWINLVERWFAELTNKRIRRGVFRSVKELELAIRDYIDVHNEDPKPFAWTRTADQILDSIARYAQPTVVGQRH